MPSYSSEQFRKDWVYSCDQDFQSTDGRPATWAPGQPTYWGNEDAKIPLPTTPADSSLNADGSLIAVALEHDIQVYTTSDLKLLQVLKGHVSRVDAVRFHPKIPFALVTCAMNYHARSVKAEPVIIFWDLDEQRLRKPDPKVLVQNLARRAVQGLVSGLQDSQSVWIPDKTEQTDLARDLERSIGTMSTKALVRDNRRIFGRLATSFGGHVFNRDGTSIVYLPGERPSSKGVNKWDIYVWDTAKAENRLTLEGHTDAITWIGFSPDDKLIGSVCWDQTFRIWIHETGTLLHTFRSNQQNWTGGFSPDSRYFAGTSGEGRFWIWDMLDGSDVATHDFGPSGRWCRTLDWSPDGRQLVLGGRGLGRLIVFDIEDKRIVQERSLSTKNCPENLPRFTRDFLEVSSVRYLPGGRKIAFQTSGDNGLEVYDRVDNSKWRFAPRA
ncbi:hypothetical protein LTR28_007959, partial [Elasticomyces elasticus]